DVRTLLDRTRHNIRRSALRRRRAAPAAADDVLVRCLVPLPRLPPLGLAPGRGRRAAARRTALAAAQRVVDRVHRHAPDLRPPSAPAIGTRLPDPPELVVDVPDLPDRRQAVTVDHADLGRRQPDGDVIALLRHHLGPGAGGTHDLSALPRLELDVVDHRAERDLAKRERVPDPDVRARTAHHRVSLLQSPRVQDVTLLPIGVMDQRDVRRTVRIVLDLGNPTGDAELVALEVDPTLQALRAAAPTATRDVPVIVAPAALLQRLDQRPLGLGPRDLFVHGDRPEPRRRRHG